MAQHLDDLALVNHHPVLHPRAAVLRTAGLTDIGIALSFNVRCLYQRWLLAPAHRPSLCAGTPTLAGWWTTVLTRCRMAVLPSSTTRHCATVLTRTVRTGQPVGTNGEFMAFRSISALPAALTGGYYG
jgi:hypothetical protein